MTPTYPISKTINTFADLKQKFNLSPTGDELFFSEWQEDLPSLSVSEKEALGQIKQRFERHRERSPLTEGVINQLLISPLLTLAGLYDEPFYVTTEASVELEIEDDDKILRGRIDTLIIAQKLWVLIVESTSTIAFPVALPKIMTYMMAHPNPERPVYGLIGTGDDLQFIKMLPSGIPQYDFSNMYSCLLYKSDDADDSDVV
ncbi:MAG: type I restriction endonuclease subunit R [Microcystaceae cyanobacterium]